MQLRALPLLLLAAASVTPAAAQRRTEPAARLEVGPAAPAAAAALAPEASRGRRRAAPGRAALNMLGGALIGAGAGFLTSQVAWSDWDKSSNSEFKSRRLSFTLGGSALGALTGLVLGRSTSGSDGYRGGAPAAPVNRTAVITEEEVRASTAANLYQLVQALRPLWLRREGGVGRTAPPDPAAPDAPTVVSNEADAGVKVYVERGFVGDIFSLRQIAVTETTSLEFLDTAAATYRFGPGHPAGVIVVHTGRQR